MPDQSSHYTQLDSAYRVRAYLSLMTGDAVLVGTVSATPSDPVLNIAYTVTSGSASDVRSGMRVVVRSSGGAFKGTLSVRYSGTISTTNLPVREFSSGDVQVVSGDVFTVYSDLLPSDKLVSADETFSPDSTTYTDQNADPPPLVTSGGWWAGWVTNSPVPFYGVDSVTVDADSVSGVTHAWAASGGTLSAASGDSTTLTVTTAGKYIVTHTGTDPDNSKSAAQYIPVRAHDASDPPLDIFLNSLDGDEATGFRTSLELLDAGTLDDIPDLAPVIVWADEWHGDTNASYGAAVAGRGHIICAGYLRRDTTSLDADDETLTFEVVSPIALLEEIAGFSKYFAQASSPASWQEIAGLSVWRAIIQILRHYTNYLDLFDLVFVSILNRDYPNFPIQKSNPVAQIRELADAIDCRFVEADRTGRMEVQRILDLTPLDERDTPATTLTLTKDRFIECEVTREHFAPLETYRLRGFIKGYTDNTPVFARFPASPGRGTLSGTVEKIIADDQADALERCALRGAQANRVFFDADGVKHHAPTARLRLFGNYAQALGFHREWIAFSGYTTVRGIDLSDYRWSVASISVRYDGEEDAETEFELRAETHAPASGAVDDTPSVVVTTPTEPPITFPPPTNPPAYVDGLPVLPVDLALMSGDGKLYLTSNASRLRLGEAPTATGYNLSLTGTPRDFTVRADSPKYLGTGAAVNAHIVTDTRYYSIADLAGARTLSNTLVLEASPSYKQMQFERGDPNWGIIAYYVASVGVRVRYTTDGGATWSSAITVSANYESTGLTGADVGLWLSPSGNGTAYVTAYTNTATGTSLNSGLYKTTDYGATWSASSDFGFVGSDLTAYCLAAGVPDTSKMYYGVFNGAISGYDPRLYRNNVDITPNVGSGGRYAPVHNRGVSIADDDANTVVLAGTPNFASGGTRKVFRTFNGRATAPTWTELTSTNIANARRIYAVNRLTYYLIGVSGYLAYVADGTKVNEGVISGAGEIVGIAGV